MKRKVFMLLVSAAVITSLALVGCAPEVAPPAPPPTEEEGAPPAAPAEEANTWQLQGFTPAGLFFHDLAEHLAASVEEMSGGRLVFDLYPSPAIVPALESIDAVAAPGVLDAAYTYPAM